MGTTIETIKGLRNVPKSHAQWCFYVRSITDAAVVVRADYGALEAMKVERRFTQAGKPPILEKTMPKGDSHPSAAPPATPPPKNVAASAPNIQSPINDVADTDHIKPVPE
jgi:hypothetical protein